MEPDAIKIKVIGIGNAGLNICESLIERQNTNIEIYAADTDKNKLNKTKITNKIILGTSLNGSGTGGDPKLGAQAAEESSEQIAQIIDDCNMLIIVSGFGGGTGTGASETIAKLARNKNILTLAIITLPMADIVGKRKLELANNYLEKLTQCVNSYMVIDNNRMLQQNAELPMYQAVKMANVAVETTIDVIDDIISNVSDLNIDFSDIKSALINGGKIVVASGKSQNGDKVTNAFEAARDSSSFIDKPTSFATLLTNCTVDTKISYADILELRKKIIEEYQLPEDIDGKFGIDYKEHEDSRDDYLKFSYILTQGNHNSSTSYIINNNMDLSQIIDDEITNAFNSYDSSDSINKNIDKLPEF
ncbi:Cell division protein FtsZ [Mycoplasmopsis bovigenitalium 51080]|uniref:Cell division protein FtsZ n=1 Tax=Mycoplasmopsis bovigenitalium 51080 TaxID=1188235 RepID=N9V4C4_9BACT|nr:cell division protein FtsZ [Mycoplasmopsis bovigenitalium]ENY70177.1 Cell division protein FtsZ [Mycoplasmopsis bovigenitalium 51080]